MGDVYRPLISPAARPVTELDPVTFQPYPADAPVVTLGLTYDSEPTGYARAGFGVPLWLLLLGGAYVAANFVGGRI